MKFIFALTVVAGAASATLNDTSVSRQLQEAPPSICLLTSYLRGVGTVPKSCARGQERIGAFCYEYCPSGMSRKAFDCHSNCPKANKGYVFEDIGVFCRLKEYDRGAGYPWKFGDAFDDSGMFKRCEAANGGSDKCEKNGLVVYPKCKEGYTAFGCCICRPNPPDCEKLGLGGNVDLSCAKKVIIGKPDLGTCEPDEDLYLGLCYKKCKAGFSAQGLACEANIPSGWVKCDKGAAKTSAMCADIEDNLIDFTAKGPTCDRVVTDEVVPVDPRSLDT
ncbi:hypothetical protein H310_11565 [Aphanomyces invadans]|uniref:Uncharacterized protein n=1 Tax=Aphanomyces invadans TaxID=157072 RepID=A0A024TLS8_9STRA|nr:hypothetical protein H310_11565 [Aphanomyces invadans]ETV94919.1 hypothetical protein H310_11565 [Aphanomyces invadans]RHY24457.1 hypothetical protein DYB32_008846 [Aphanomyces invadans]|eukprot:XP_008876510.1 hypothetical protein H310_11565 [Aphanomyces invadans]